MQISIMETWPFTSYLNYGNCALEYTLNMSKWSKQDQINKTINAEMIKTNKIDKKAQRSQPILEMIKTSTIDEESTPDSPDW